MVAREVDAACQQMKESDEVRNRVTTYFNDRSESPWAKAAKILQPQNIATLDVLMRPEFSDIRSHFETINEKLKQSQEGFGKEGFLKEFGQAHINADLTVTLKPEQAQAVVCNPDIMDPIISLKNIPSIDPARMKTFEEAVATQQAKLQGMLDGDVDNYVSEVMRVDAEGQKTFPAVGNPSPGSIKP